MENESVVPVGAVLFVAGIYASMLGHIFEQRWLQWAGGVLLALPILRLVLWFLLA